MTLINKISINLINYSNKLLNCNQLKRIIFLQNQQAKCYSTDQSINEDDNEMDKFLNENEYLDLKNEFLRTTKVDQSVFVIQPFLRTRRDKNNPIPGPTPADLMLGIYLFLFIENH